MDTIVALATGNTTAGISIIRVSGENALDISKKLLTKDKVFVPRYMYLCEVTAGNIHDKGLVVYFKAPNSFTGEDVVEFHLHGGMALSHAVLEALIMSGARLAEAGEFSKRAFLNGKTSLDSLEGTIDLINAQSEAELKAGYNLLIGTLKDKTENIQSALTDILAEIDVALDYPDEDIEYETTESIKNKISLVAKDISALIDTSKTGSIISSGINVAIVGKPNVGKSSLLNGLLAYDRAIVTDIAGTTRDILRESYVFDSIRVNLTDTAGIHDSNDTVEKIGIERSIRAINEAHLLLLVLDSATPLDAEDERIISICAKESKPIIVALNKSDIKQFDMFDKISSLLPTAHIIETSAHDQTALNDLKRLIKSLCVNDFDANALFITNTRHLAFLQSALHKLALALDNIDIVSLDCISVHLKDAWNNMGEITGKVITEEVLDAIFSKFCLGK